MSREYEIRLTVQNDAADSLVSHRLIRRSLRHRKVGRMVSTYFDTPDSKLQRNCFGLRVRRSNTEVTQTLKRTGGSLVDRGEWERTKASFEPDIVWLRKTPIASLLRNGSIAESLGPRFTVEVTRTALPLRHKRAVIEVAIDQGAISSDGMSLPLNELELELKRGRSDAVLDLARTLARDLPLTLSLASKAERGYGISDLSWGQPSDSIRPQLRRRMTIAQAFELIVQTCLNTLLKNVALIQDARDGEAVHASRIALRHLRAACQLFSPVVRRKRFIALRKKLRWLSSRLSEARDADVFQKDVFEPAAHRNDMPGAKALAQVTNERRRQAHRRLKRVLRSARARLLYIDLLAFSEDGIRRKARTRNYRPFVRDALLAHRRRLARRARGLAAQTQVNCTKSAKPRRCFGMISPFSQKHER